MRRIGVAGISEGDGHPFSFSAIINGFSEDGMAASGWSGIHEYVRRKDRSEFGVADLAVTHAWTQDPEVTARLCHASLIPNVCGSLHDFLGNVDAVILARDDHESHWDMARPFLEAGVPVLVDKPLSVEPQELQRFLPYLESGQLMSCSGLRWATELDDPRSRPENYGKLKLVRGAVVNSWEKYGIHMLEGIFGVLRCRPVSVQRHVAAHASMAVETDDGTLVLIDALADAATPFRIDFYGTKLSSVHEIRDNFTMFRRMLWAFASMLSNGTPAVPPRHTVDMMKTLIAGRCAAAGGGKVSLDDVVL